MIYRIPAASVTGGIVVALSWDIAVRTKCPNFRKRVTESPEAFGAIGVRNRATVADIEGVGSGY